MIFDRSTTFNGSFRVTRISSNTPEIADGSIQVVIESREPMRRQIVLTMDPATFAAGLTGYALPEGSCKIEARESSDTPFSAKDERQQ